MDCLSSLWVGEHAAPIQIGSRRGAFLMMGPQRRTERWRSDQPVKHTPCSTGRRALLDIVGEER